MQTSQGILRKMRGQLATPIQYAIPLSETLLTLNQKVGKEIKLNFTGKIFCIHCERKISKSFQQGYCYPCYQRLLECNLCIIHPERCQVEKGTCPVDDWAHAQCHQAHVIYLANTSGIKVGITRKTQVPTRWIDQGAVQAIPMLEVGNRYRAGVIEVAFKEFVNDKTNWRKMLKNEVVLIDLHQQREMLLASAAKVMKAASEKFKEDVKILTDDAVLLEYPVESYPSKIISLSLEKTPTIEAKLLGIKGQYLLLDQGVINLRKFGGYELEVQV